MEEVVKEVVMPLVMVLREGISKHLRLQLSTNGQKTCNPWYQKYEDAARESAPSITMPAKSGSMRGRYRVQKKRTSTH